MTLRKIWSDPFLWIQAAGIVLVPIGLLVVAMGLASGDPMLPPWLEESLVAVAGIVPIFLMQWFKPFYSFSLLAAALSPEQLSEQRRRILSAFLTSETKLLAGLTAFLLLQFCKRIYEIAPLFESLTPVHFSGGARLSGLVIASLGFLGANLFLQVSVSVIRILLFTDQEIASLPVLEFADVEAHFTILGTQKPDLLSRYELKLGGSDPVEPSVELSPSSIHEQESQGSP